MWRNARWTVAVMGSAVLAPMARAELIEFTFGGALEQVMGNVPAPWSGIALGTPFSVSYIFDSEAPDLDDSSLFGIYDAILSYTVTLAGTSVTTHSGVIEVELIGIPRYFAWVSDLPLGEGAFGEVHFSGFGVLNDDSLLSDINLSQWNDPIFRFGGLNNGLDFEAAGVIDYFSRRIVPSPGTASALLATMVVRCRRRRNICFN